MTDIEWTHADGFKGESWNPIVGCSLASPGCTNCYAMRKAHRLEQISYGKSKGAHGLVHYRGLTKSVNGKRVWGDIVKSAPHKNLLKPLHWRKPRMVFVNSMGDLFHDYIPDAMIDRVFAIMALCPQHRFLILTKRAERMREYVTAERYDEINSQAMAFMDFDIMPTRAPGPLSNVWLGVSAEDQKRANERIPPLLDTPAAKRFVSCEPLIGPVDLSALDVSGDEEILPLGAGWLGRLETGEHETAKLDWVITGGESGPGARPPHPDWFRSLRDQCAAAGVPFFFKQWGSWAPVWPHETDTPEDKLRIVKSFEGCDISEEQLMANLGKGKTGNRLDCDHHLEFPATAKAEAA